MKLKSAILAGITATVIGAFAPGAMNAADRDKSATSRHERQKSVASDEAAPPCPINKASHLMGTTVKNQHGEKLGKIKDVVLNFDSGEVAYVVVAKSGAKKGTGKYVALPLSAFTPSTDAKYLVLDSDKDRIRNAQGFAAKDWPPVDTAFGAPSAMDEIIILDRRSQPDENSQPEEKQEQDNDKDKDYQD